MKTGDKVSFYTTRTAFCVSAGREKEYIKHLTGTLIRFDDYQAEIVPDGKQKTIIVPIERVHKCI